MDMTSYDQICIEKADHGLVIRCGENESIIRSDFITKIYEKLDVIINIVDATNLSRSLFFTTQLLELGIPTVVALNKADINKKKNTRIDV